MRGITGGNNQSKLLKILPRNLAVRNLARNQWVPEFFFSKKEVKFESDSEISIQRERAFPL